MHTDLQNQMKDKSIILSSNVVDLVSCSIIVNFVMGSRRFPLVAIQVKHS